MQGVIILPVQSWLARTSASGLVFSFDVWTSRIHKVGIGPCDRFAATMKNHVRAYVNEGHDVITAEQFQEAMLSNGGVPGARIVLLPDPLCDKPTCKFPGISKVNSFEFSSDGVKVWRAYQVGEGKQFSWSQFEGKKNTSYPLCHFLHS